MDDMILTWDQHCCKCYDPPIDPKVKPCCPTDKCDDCLQIEFDDEKGGYDMLCLKKKKECTWSGHLIKDGSYVAVTCDEANGGYLGGKMEVRNVEYLKS